MPLPNLNMGSIAVIKMLARLYTMLALCLIYVTAPATAQTSAAFCMQTPAPTQTTQPFSTEPIPTTISLIDVQIARCIAALYDTELDHEALKKHIIDRIVPAPIMQECGYVETTFEAFFSVYEQQADKQAFTDHMVAVFMFFDDHYLSGLPNLEFTSIADLEISDIARLVDVLHVRDQALDVGFLNILGTNEQPERGAERERLVKGNNLHAYFELQDCLRYREATPFLHMVLDQMGWPDEDRTTAKTSANFWLLVQHQDHDIALQEKALGALKKAVAEDKALARNFAFLSDRVAVNKGEPQLFATQTPVFFLPAGEYRLGCPSQGLVLPNKIDELRAIVGLHPIAEDIDDCLDKGR